MYHEISFERFYCVLRDISATLHADTKVSEVLDTVVRKATEAFHAKGAILRTLNLETHQLELTAACGLGEQFLAKGPASQERIITDLYRLKEIIIIRDIENDPRIQYSQEALAEGIRMALDAPLTIGNNIIGILRIYFSEPREFSEEEKNFAKAVAEQGAMAIGKAQIIENQRTRFNQLIIQTEKLTALGRMAAGIAHEINNPLAGVLLYASNLLKKVPPEGPLREGLELIVHETIRCKRIIQELLEFSRESVPNMTRADINEIITKAISILTNEFKLRHIHIHTQLSREIPELLLDKNQVEQVFVNLLINAAQAIEERGDISVRTYVAGKMVRCEVADTGSGIPPEHMSRIFEPFFSTKNKGTGLGLSVSYGIVQKHQGRIYASSIPGKQGTLFTVELPIPREGSFPSEEAQK